MSDDNNSPAPPRETTGKNFRILDGAAMPPDVDISDTQWALVEYDGDQMVRIVGVDGGEPEDQTLVRDWNWVAVEMNALARQLRASEDARRKAEARAERWATHAVDVERERDTARAELEAVRRERDEANVSLRSLRTELWEGAREHGLTAPLQGSESARLIAAYCGGIVKAREERDAAANEREEWRRAADYHRRQGATMKTIDDVMEQAVRWAQVWCRPGDGPEEKALLRAAIEAYAEAERERTIWDVYRAVKRAAVTKDESGRFRCDVNPSAFARIKGAIRALTREYRSALAGKAAP
jgi:hypothetical protein